MIKLKLILWLISATTGALVLIAPTLAGACSINGSPVEGLSGSAQASETEAVISTTISAGTTTTSYYFEYGTSTSYGNRTVARAVATSGSLTVQETITGLSSATNYHYRIVVNYQNPTDTDPSDGYNSCSGLSYSIRGTDATFTTNATVTTTETPPPPSTPPETPTSTESCGDVAVKHERKINLAKRSPVVITFAAGSCPGPFSVKVTNGRLKNGHLSKLLLRASAVRITLNGRTHRLKCSLAGVTDSCSSRLSNARNVTWSLGVNPYSSLIASGTRFSVAVKTGKRTLTKQATLS